MCNPGRRITDLDSLKEIVVEEWNRIPQEIFDKCVDVCNLRLQRAIEVKGQHIEQYWLLIIHIDISEYVFVKFGMVLIN